MTLLEPHLHARINGIVIRNAKYAVAFSDDLCLFVIEREDVTS